MTVITLERAVVEQALESLLWHYQQGHSNETTGMRLKIDEKSIRALRAALAEQEKKQEPVAELPAHPVRRAYDRSGAPCPNKGWTDAEANVLRRQHAEIAELRAEVERLRADVAAAELRRQHAEIADLRAEDHDAVLGSIYAAPARKETT